MKREETVDFHIKSTWHNISRYYNAVAAKYNSTMALGFILLTIDIKHGTLSTKLGPAMGMTARSLVRSLSHLEKNKLIIRKPEKDDKRKVRIVLTNEGIAAREIAKETVLNFNDAIRQQLSDQEIENFLNTIAKINSSISELNNSTV